MTVTPERQQLEEFRGLIAARFGWNCDESRLDHLTDVLRRRTEASGTGDTERYLRWLSSRSATVQELRALAEELTVGETFFFRNPDHFHALMEQVIPERLRVRNASRRLRLLSAGCASGEEPYSLAALISDLPGMSSWDVRITGIDLNPASLARAAAGRYSAWSLRGTPEDARRRYFEPDGKEFVLNPDIRQRVTFEERNLADDDPNYWCALDCDVIFCRNVLMYFTPEAMNAIVRRLTQALAPGGYLFLGHAETLRGLTQGFELCHTNDTFYYRLRDGAQRQAERGSVAVDLRSDPPPIPEPSTTWYDAILQASERVARLTESRNAPPPSEEVTEKRERRTDLSAVHALMERERFTQALTLLDGLVASGSDALLLRASLLTNSGRLAESEAVCRALLAQDDLNAGAHYLMALCREQAADSTGAMEHDQAAAHLDPGFAMPHLHLGLLSRRLGDRATARRELGLAQALLGREDSSRVLLFGGGFSREALMGLCQSELTSLGGER